MDFVEQQKCQMYINDLLNSNAQKEEALEKAYKIIEILKQDFEKSIKDLKRCEKDKEKLAQELKQLEKEYTISRRDMNQLETLKKTDEKHKFMYVQQRDKTENLHMQMQQREEQYKAQIMQMQDEILQLKDLLTQKNYEMEEQIHQYRVKENGFAHALQSLQDKEDLINQQEVQIQELLAQKSQVNVQYMNEMQTLKRLAENFYRADNQRSGSDHKYPATLKKSRIETKRKNEDEGQQTPFGTIYVAEQHLQAIVNQLILDQKEQMDRVKALVAPQDFIIWEKELERFIQRIAAAFDRVNDLYVERNNIYTLLKDFQYAYDDLKTNQENFVQAIKIGMLKIEKSLLDEPLEVEIIHSNSKSVEQVMNDNIPRLMDIINRRKEELAKLKQERLQTQDLILSRESQIEELNRSLQSYKQLYTELEKEYQSQSSIRQKTITNDEEVEQLRKLTNRLQSELSARGEDTATLKLRQAQKAVEDLQVTNKNLQQYNEVLKNELLMKKDDEADSLIIDELNEQNKQLLDQLNQLSQEHAHTVEMLERALSQLEDLHNAQSRNSPNRKQADQIDQIELEELKELLEITQENKKNLEQQLDGFKRIVEEQEYQIERLNQALDTQENQLNIQQSDLQNQDEIIKDLQRKIKQYKFEIQEADHKLQSFQSQSQVDDTSNDMLCQILDQFLMTQMSVNQNVNGAKSLYVYNFKDLSKLAPLRVLDEQAEKQTKVLIERSQKHLCWQRQAISKNTPMCQSHLNCIFKLIKLVNQLKD